MKPQPNSEPLRGEAKWRATKDAIAKRNDAARARSAAERYEQEGRRTQQRLAADRQQADKPQS